MVAVARIVMILSGRGGSDIVLDPCLCLTFAWAIRERAGESDVPEGHSRPISLGVDQKSGGSRINGLISR